MKKIVCVIITMSALSALLYGCSLQVSEGDRTYSLGSSDADGVFEITDDHIDKLDRIIEMREKEKGDEDD